MSASPGGGEGGDLPTERARGLLYLSQLNLGSRISRIHKHANRADVRNDLAQQFQPLGQQLDGERGYARNVTAWAIEAGDEAETDRIAGASVNDGNRRGRSFGRES